MCYRSCECYHPAGADNNYQGKDYVADFNFVEKSAYKTKLNSKNRNDKCYDIYKNKSCTNKSTCRLNIKSTDNTKKPVKKANTSKIKANTTEKPKAVPKKITKPKVKTNKAKKTGR